jgi:transmembrane sensor
MDSDITDLVLMRAIELWTRRRSGAPWTDTDEARLQAWLAVAPQHQAAYTRVARTWDATGELAGLIERAAPPRRRPLRQRALAVCAAVLLAAIALPLGDLAYRIAPPAAPLSAWTTHPGEPRALTLPDGTQVLLDGNSELVAQMGPTIRRVSLRRGEAMFTVTHDPSRPFQVDVAGGQVQDLSTRFDVELLGSGVHVNVLEGDVTVSAPRGRRSLTAGQAGGFDRSGALLPVRKADPATGPGSRRHFNAEPLADVLERLARYHAVTFVLSDSALQELRISGNFRIDDMPTFLRTLSVALPIETHALDSGRIEVSPRAADPALLEQRR